MARPAERSNSVQNTLDRLRAAQQQSAPPQARPSTAAGRPAAGGGSPTGTAQLSQGDIRGIGEQISECWSVDAGMQGIETMTVQMQLDVDPNGVVRNVRPVGGVPTDPRLRALYEQSRRAVLDPKCAQLPISRDKIPAMANTILRFSPRGFVR